MGCQGSRNRQDDVSNRPGYIAFDVKTIQYLKVNESEIKSKLRERCEQKLANKKQLTHSTSIRSVLRRSRLSTEDSDLKSSKSRQSLKDSSQMVESVVDQVVKYAVNDYKLNTQMSVDQLVKDIIKQGTSSSPENTSTTDSNNNSVSETTDNRFYKKTLNVALDELDMYLQENSLVISEFEMPVVEEQEPVMKLKDALELARQMFYEGIFFNLFSSIFFS